MEQTRGVTFIKGGFTGGSVEVGGKVPPPSSVLAQLGKKNIKMIIRVGISGSGENKCEKKCGKKMKTLSNPPGACGCGCFGKRGTFGLPVG